MVDQFRFAPCAEDKSHSCRPVSLRRVVPCKVDVSAAVHVGVISATTLCKNRRDNNACVRHLEHPQAGRCRSSLPDAETFRRDRRKMARVRKFSERGKLSSDGGLFHSSFKPRIGGWGEGRRCNQFLVDRRHISTFLVFGRHAPGIFPHARSITFVPISTLRVVIGIAVYLFVVPQIVGELPKCSGRACAHCLFLPPCGRLIDRRCALPSLMFHDAEKLTVVCRPELLGNRKNSTPLSPAVMCNTPSDARPGRYETDVRCSPR